MRVRCNVLVGTETCTLASYIQSFTRHSSHCKRLYNLSPLDYHNKQRTKQHTSSSTRLFLHAQCTPPEEYKVWWKEWNTPLDPAIEKKELAKAHAQCPATKDECYCCIMMTQRGYKPGRSMGRLTAADQACMAAIDCEAKAWRFRQAAHGCNVPSGKQC
jgi:hypothetical protein